MSDYTRIAENTTNNAPYLKKSIRPKNVELTYKDMTPDYVCKRANDHIINKAINSIENEQKKYNKNVERGGPNDVILRYKNTIARLETVKNQLVASYNPENKQEGYWTQRITDSQDQQHDQGDVARRMLNAIGDAIESEKALSQTSHLHAGDASTPPPLTLDQIAEGISKNQKGGVHFS